MRVKRYFAADMRSAMKLVRDEMGPEASIIANRRVAGGIELTAALDYEAPRLTPPTPGLDAELKKTQERIISARASLQAGERPSAGPSVNRQLFGDSTRQAAEQGSSVARELLDRLNSERSAPEAQPTEAAHYSQTTGSGAGDGMDVMRAEIAGLRDLLESQLGGLAWGQISQHQPRSHCRQRFLGPLPGHGSHRRTETVHAGCGGAGNKGDPLQIGTIPRNIVNRSGANGHQHLRLIGQLLHHHGYAMFIGMKPVRRQNDLLIRGRTDHTFCIIGILIIDYSTKSCDSVFCKVFLKLAQTPGFHYRSLGLHHMGSSTSTLPVVLPAVNFQHAASPPSYKKERTSPADGSKCARSQLSNARYVFLKTA